MNERTLTPSSASEPNLQKVLKFCCFCLRNVSRICTRVGLSFPTHYLRLGPVTPYWPATGAHFLLYHGSGFLKHSPQWLLPQLPLLDVHTMDAHYCVSDSLGHLGLPLGKDVRGGPQFCPISK